MKKIIIKLFKFRLMQMKWGRKYIGGHFFHIDCIQLSMAPFWSDKQITSCQAKLIGWEYYPPIQKKTKSQRPTD